MTSMDHKPAFQLFYDPDPLESVDRSASLVSNSQAQLSHSNPLPPVLSVSVSVPEIPMGPTGRTVLGDLPVRTLANPFHRASPLKGLSSGTLASTCDSRLKHETDLRDEISTSSASSFSFDEEDEDEAAVNVSQCIAHLGSTCTTRNATICSLQTGALSLENEESALSTAGSETDFAHYTSHPTPGPSATGIANHSPPAPLSASSLSSNSDSEAQVEKRIRLDESKENVPPVKRLGALLSTPHTRLKGAFQSLVKSFASAQVDPNTSTSFSPFEPGLPNGPTIYDPQALTSHATPHPFRPRDNDLCANLPPILPLRRLPRSCPGMSSPRDHPSPMPHIPAETAKSSIKLDPNTIHQRHRSLPNSLMRI